MKIKHPGHSLGHNFIRQFLNVTFNEIFCLLALFLFYGTTAKYFASGNTWWLLWPKCWLETEFDYRFGLRFSKMILNWFSKCVWLFSWAKNRSISHFSNLKRNYIYDHFCLCSWWVKCKYWISFLQISNIQYHLLRTFCSSWWGQLSAF